MRYGVIDVGSNSVRLMISENGKTLKKLIATTRLAEGKEDGFLCEKSSLRTLKAIKEYAETAREYGADEIFAFATAAVRNSVNGADFASKAKEISGVKLDVVSGETEAALGLYGALKGKDGAVLDIGGGSTEIGVVKDGKLVYSKSLPVGAVVLTQRFGQDCRKMTEYLKAVVKEYGAIPPADFYCIGGTCTTLAAVAQKLTVYAPEKVDGYKLTAGEIARLFGDIAALTVEERKSVAGIQKERADIIHAGAAIFNAVAEYVGVPYFTVSESDNLEGYLKYITEKK
nr:rod shape-determining protein [Clostridia bacterium]